MKLIELSEVEILIMKSIWKLGDGIGMHTRYDTIDLLSAWSLERSAILLGCIADELGNAEVFPFERKMPEKFIGELDEYMCR